MVTHAGRSPGKRCSLLGRSCPSACGGLSSGRASSTRAQIDLQVSLSAPISFPSSAASICRMGVATCRAIAAVVHTIRKGLQRKISAFLQSCISHINNTCCSTSSIVVQWQYRSVACLVITHLPFSLFPSRDFRSKTINAGQSEVTALHEEASCEMTACEDETQAPDFRADPANSSAAWYVNASAGV